jgi:hypothetical protein
VQVHYDEGVAVHIGPEPCVGVRKDGDEASVGEGIGQPLSRESQSPGGIATRSLRRKMARSPSRAGGRRTRLQLRGKGRNHARGGMGV